MCKWCSSMHSNPALSTMYFITLEEYILLFPFAITVKYRDVAISENSAAGKRWLSINVSIMYTFAPGFAVALIFSFDEIFN